MFCTNCGEQMQDGQAVCTKCGFAKDTGNKYCGNCGAEIQPQQAVCTQCGCVVNEAKKQAEANKASAGDQVGGQDKIVVILVAIFIGTLGIHNFIMGETKKGVFKLVMSLVGGWFCGLGVLVSLILTIMDIVKIASGTYVVDPDKLI
ncbi:MAG: TM2 domain-containing protein [Eubacterium sp.]|nr:TM2 domain-containing protein [Eubacterium sp.]